MWSVQLRDDNYFIHSYRPIPTLATLWSPQYTTYAWELGLESFGCHAIAYILEAWICLIDWSWHEYHSHMHGGFPRDSKVIIYVSGYALNNNITIRHALGAFPGTEKQHCTRFCQHVPIWTPYMLLLIIRGILKCIGNTTITYVSW